MKTKPAIFFAPGDLTPTEYRMELHRKLDETDARRGAEREVKEAFA